MGFSQKIFIKERLIKWIIYIANQKKIWSLSLNTSVKRKLAQSEILNMHEDTDSKKIIEKKYVLLASSHHREEIIIIKEWLKLKSNKYLLVVAPRHPERLGDILFNSR